MGKDVTEQDENNKCPKCGLPFYDDHKSTAIPQLCKYKHDNITNRGWECPRCGRINAPWMPYCNCQRNQYEGFQTITEWKRNSTLSEPS